MSNIIPFSFENSSVRTLVLNDQPWFVATDVCSVLGLKNVTMAIRHLDDDEQALSSIEGRSENGVEQSREVNIISESGLYALILRSRKPEARRFRKWITSEVIPSIRNTGSYPGNSPITGRRWMWSIDHNGNECLKPIPDDAFVMNMSRLSKVLAEPGGLIISNNELIELAFAAIHRLVKRCVK